MDLRKKEAWRAWVTDPVPENAQRYCSEHARTERRSGKNQRLSDLETGLELRISDTLKAAVELYLDQDWEDAYVEDLDALTECHYWLLEGVSPRVLRQLSEFHEKHDMVLREGDERQFRAEHDRAKQRESEGSRWLTRAKSAEISLKLRENKIKRLNLEISGLNKEIVDLKRDEGIKQRDREIEDLKRQIGKSRDEVASMGILRKENERLTRLLQEKNN